jgi:hypothetical protein
MYHNYDLVERTFHLSLFPDFGLNTLRKYNYGLQNSHILDTIFLPAIYLFYSFNSIRTRVRNIVDQFPSRSTHFVNGNQYSGSVGFKLKQIDHRRLR